MDVGDRHQDMRPKPNTGLAGHTTHTGRLTQGEEKGPKNQTKQPKPLHQLVRSAARLLWVRWRGEGGNIRTTVAPKPAARQGPGAVSSRGGWTELPTSCACCPKQKHSGQLTFCRNLKIREMGWVITFLTLAPPPRPPPKPDMMTLTVALTRDCLWVLLSLPLKKKQLLRFLQTRPGEFQIYTALLPRRSVWLVAWVLMMRVEGGGGTSEQQQDRPSRKRGLRKVESLCRVPG